MNETETLEHIGQLIQLGRLEHQKSQLGFSKEIDLNVQTLRTMERGERMAQAIAQSKVEKGLGWRTGAIREVWEDRENLTVEQVTLEEMRRGAGEATFQEIENGQNKPVMKAQLLSDDEIVMELMYRLRNYRAEIERFRGGLA